MTTAQAGPKLGFLRGVVGIVKWGYYNAAGLEGYEVRYDRAARVFRLSGRVIVSDPFKLRQRPLRFSAPYRTKDGHERSWEWVITSFDIQDGVIRADMQDSEGT